MHSASDRVREPPAIWTPSPTAKRVCCFAPGNVEALADAIARIIDDDDLAAEITRRALTTAIERFSINRYAAEAVSAIESIVPTGKRPARR